MPFVNAEACFALKGGTAINFFVRDFPRLSVDIDLVYLPVEDRPTTLQGIGTALERIAAIVGDFLAGSAQGGVGGIGYMTISYFSQLKTPALFATGLVACVMGFLFVGGVNWLHWRLLHSWHDSMVKKE
ncbi:MAG: hypothetical protein B9S26_13650 [Opitutia bacterium Tous-C4FEB]|nr:MAG: hypothetical protein B9S35_09810 [Opitutae bacterium Tous-C5TDCM]PAW87685.1 MAG: hypothetical protein B9S26_13650 [Opitutae bacterium Tous-C4FEB]